MALLAQQYYVNTVIWGHLNFNFSIMAYPIIKFIYVSLTHYHIKSVSNFSNYTWVSGQRRIRDHFCSTRDPSGTIFASGTISAFLQYAGPIRGTHPGPFLQYSFCWVRRNQLFALLLCVYVFPFIWQALSSNWVVRGRRLEINVALGSASKV